MLEQAQGAGQKTQQDALLGQSSIFDLEEPAPGGAPASGGPELPVPRLEDERAQLNAWEKETLGLFLSSHPLKEVRAALRAKVECSLRDLRERKDGEWVTVGGMVTECKRIRTRKGDPMMFATLDDLEGTVEMLVFNSAYAANAEKVDTDEVVIVRGRVDHKEAGEVKLIAQEVDAVRAHRRRRWRRRRRRRTPSRWSSGCPSTCRPTCRSPSSRSSRRS